MPDKMSPEPQSRFKVERCERLVILSEAKDLCKLFAARLRQRIAQVLCFAQDDNREADAPIPERVRNPFVTLSTAHFLLHIHPGEISSM
jgi:hypothetical protein